MEGDVEAMEDLKFQGLFNFLKVLYIVAYSNIRGWLQAQFIFCVVKGALSRRFCHILVKAA